MSTPNLKRLFASDKLKLGHSIFEFNSPGIGQIISTAGCDFVFLDMEHSGFGVSETKRAISGLRAGGVPALVRPPSKEYHHIARALDIGADGVILPMVASGEEAKHIIDCMKYPPQGRRGVALAIAHDHYLPEDPAKALAAANRRTACAVLIETGEGVRNIDSIASVKDVDCLWIGHFDLSCSLGVNGQFSHPDFQKACRAIERSAKKYGKALGRLAGDPAGCIALHKKGYDVLCYSGDLWVYQQALMDGISAIRKASTPGKFKKGGKAR